MTTLAICISIPLWVIALALLDIKHILKKTDKSE